MTGQNGGILFFIFENSFKNKYLTLRLLRSGMTQKTIPEVIAVFRHDSRAR